MKRLAVLVLLVIALTACGRSWRHALPTATPEWLIVRPTQAPPTEIPHNIAVTMTVEALDRLYLSKSLKWTEEAPSQYHEPQNIYSPTPQPCLNIIGNVNNGKRIYHCPGWRDYNKININTAEGDRIFCTESEARAAGFREPEYSHGPCR